MSVRFGLPAGFEARPLAQSFASDPPEDVLPVIASLDRLSEDLLSGSLDIAFVPPRTVLDHPEKLAWIPEYCVFERSSPCVRIIAARLKNASGRPWNRGSPVWKNRQLFYSSGLW